MDATTKVTNGSSGSDALFSLDTYSLLDAIPGGVLLLDIDGVVSFANSSAQRLFGSDGDDMTGQSIMDLLPDGVDRCRPDADGQYRQTGSVSVQRACRLDGTVLSVTVSCQSLHSTDGGGLLVNVAKAQPQPLRHDARDIMEVAPMGMVVMSADGTITLVNRRAADMFGYEPDELQGQTLEILLPARHRQAHVGHRDAYLVGPQASFMGNGRDLTALHQDGTEFPVEVGLNFLEDEKGTQVVAAINDITRRKQAEIALRQANADLDEFTYVASHDLKSPVRGISSLLEWIAEDLGEDIPDPVRDNIERARLRVDRMQQLIEDLLTYARAGKTDSEFVDIDVRQLFDELLEMIEVPDGFEFRLHSAFETLRAPKTPLATVLRNLFSNAVKHHDRETGIIDVSLREDGVYCVVEVSDDGPGVPPNAQERICKLFQTLSRNTAGPSSGIGLAVAKRLVDTHGGRLEIESEEDQRGTCFRVYWPTINRRDYHG